MSGVRDSILIGIALSLMVLAVFLRDWRAGAAAAVAVPITLVCTFGVMRLFGQSLNLMSAGGLAVAIGLVVDDAIVIVEAIVRRLEEGEGVAVAAERGTRDLLAAVIGTTITTVVVFAPLALIAGVVGSFFGSLAVTLSAAVILSLAVSITVVPLVASFLLRSRQRSGPSLASGRLSAAYGRIVHRVIEHPVLSIVGVVALGGVGAFAATRIPTGFLPTMDEGAMVVDFFLPAGTSLEETDRVAHRLDLMLESMQPEVVSFTRRTGAEMGPATATLQNSGDILVRLAPRGERRSVFEIMDEVRERALTEVPEARVELVQVLQDVLDDLSGNPSPIEVKFFGPDQAVLARLARAAGERVGELPELEDFFNGVEGSVPVLRVDVHPAAAQRLGVTPSAVMDDLGVALAGRVAAHVRRGDRSLGVRVRMPDGVRFDPDAIERLPLAYGGASVPLSAVASVSRPVGPSELQRENLSQVVVMTAAIQPGGDLAAASDDIAEHLRGLDIPPGYRMEIGGQLESARQTQRDLAGVFGLGVALVLAVLLVQLRSLRLALVVLLGAPLALVGAFLTLLVAGIPLNASSLMGCVLLAGLVVKNGILLLEHAQAHAADFGSFREAVAQAGVRRLRPILMTTAATIVGLVPLAFGLGAGSELQQPLALATIGGLLLSTLVTLFAVPALACAVIRDRPPAD
jgi:multidrug efflux pump subunit AcrB